MPQYLSPGVYVEEVPGTPPIVGVGTSTAGFIGVVPNGTTMPDQPGIFQRDADGNLVLDANRNPTPAPYVLAPLNERRL